MPTSNHSQRVWYSQWVCHITKRFLHNVFQDYLTVEGDLTYLPGETQKIVPVRLLELSEKDGLLEDKQVKQFVMDLSNPRQGAKLGRYPRTTVTIADLPGKWMHECSDHSLDSKRRIDR